MQFAAGFASIHAQEEQEEDGCGAAAALQVIVLDETGTITLPGSTIVLSWTDAERRPLRQAVRADGSLSICAARGATEATLWAEFGDDSSEQAVVAFEPGERKDVELRVLFGTVRPGRVVGRVHDLVTRNAVTTAGVSIAAIAGEVQTNHQGRFALSGVPEGEHELEVRHLGYAPLRHSVRITRGITTEVEVGLVPTPAQMEPLVVTVDRPRRLEIRGFYERKYWGELVGGGTFFTADDIDRRRPLRISHMVADAPGVRLRGGQLINPRVSSSFGVGGCPMAIYLDHIRINRPDGSDRASIDDFVLPVEVAGVEVYLGASEMPAEFGGHDSQCGVVVVWTK